MGKETQQSRQKPQRANHNHQMEEKHPRAGGSPKEPKDKHQPQTTATQRRKTFFPSGLAVNALRHSPYRKTYKRKKKANS